MKVEAATRWLLLDAGNSALKWGLYRAGTMLREDSGAIPLEGRAFAGRLEALLRVLARPDAIFGCAVASHARTHAIEELCAIHLALPVRWFAAQARFSSQGVLLESGYREPAQLGADRWHAMLGARHLRARDALLVVSAGTAMTADAILADGRFAGGTISPGIALQRGALASGTARLPAEKGDYAPLPTCTDDAIRTGILDGLVGLVERRARTLVEQAGLATPPALVLTGGASPALEPLLRAARGLGTITLEPDLVLRGLWLRAASEGAEG
jgi:type III pantothenate kinase